MLNRLLYYVVFGWMYLHALLPFRLLYILSDILCFLIYRIIGYRIKVVRKNMINSFPEKTEKELRKLEKEFYHHFCDYIVETIKVLHISDEEIQRRIRFNNLSFIKDRMKEGNSCLFLLGHYGNWEWVTAITMMFDKHIQMGQIYRPLKNKAFDKIFLKIRGRFGSLSIAKDETLRKIVKLRSEGKQTVIGFMADQTPSPQNIHYWTDFLNQRTPVFTGVERIAKQTGFFVVYLDMIKVARGKYECNCIPISDEPKSESDFVITEKYIREFEKTVLRNPAYWLWSHKRWKYQWLETRS